MRCEDCGATVVGEDVELGAIMAGITICEECIASIEDEADRYEQERIDAGEPRCNWFDRQLAAHGITLATSAALPAGREGA